VLTALMLCLGNRWPIHTAAATGHGYSVLVIDSEL
jgi:hypothetical protein